MFLKPININKIIVNQVLATKEILLRRESPYTDLSYGFHD